MTLKEQYALLVEEAKTAYTEGNVEEGDAKTSEAQKVLNAMKGLANLEALSGQLPRPPEPMRPPLPGTGTMDTLPPEPGPAENPFVKTFYVHRFKEPDDFVKGLLIELHGSDYMGKYWRQRQAFIKYLRHGDRALTPEDWAAGREVILYPGAVMKALEDGIDSIAALKTTMVEAIDYLGGYIVPVDFQNRIIERLPGLTVVRGGGATVLATSRDAMELPKSTGGGSQYTSAIRGFWVDEQPTAAGIAANLSFGTERVPIHTYMSAATISKNLLEDAVFPLEPFLVRKFSEVMAIDEDNAFLNGDGAGKPQGILQNAKNDLSLTEDVSGAAATITWDGLKSVPYSIDAQYRQNAKWIAEKATYEVIAKLKDGVGAYEWKQDQRIGQPGTLEGYPVLEQEAMPTIAANAYAMIFGDLSGYYIGDRVGMSVQRYDDSTTGQANQVIIVCRRRLGGQVAEPWRFVVLKIAAS